MQNANSEMSTEEGPARSGDLNRHARAEKDESVLLPGERRQTRRRKRPLGPMSIAALLFVFGGLLTLLLPPVGIILMLTGILVFLWGFVSAARQTRASS